MKNKEERIKSTAQPSITPPTHTRQLHHRHTTKMNDSKIQAEADSDSSIDSALKREKQLFLTSKKYIFTKNRLQRKDQIISLEIIGFSWRRVLVN